MLAASDLIIVKAKLRLRTPTEGGRTIGIMSGFRPNHGFEPNDDIQQLVTYMGQIQFDGNEWLQPGETKIVTVRFLRNGKLDQYMRIGQKWQVYEGPRVIGDAEMVEIIS